MCTRILLDFIPVSDLIALVTSYDVAMCAQNLQRLWKKTKTLTTPIPRPIWTYLWTTQPYRHDLVAPWFYRLLQQNFQHYQTACTQSLFETLNIRMFHRHRWIQFYLQDEFQYHTDDDLLNVPLLQYWLTTGPNPTFSIAVREQRVWDNTCHWDVLQDYLKKTDYQYIFCTS